MTSTLTIEYPRYPGETIKIGDDVEVCIMKAEGGRVSVGISAPRNLVVLRGELQKLPPRRVPEDPKRALRRPWPDTIPSR